MYAGATDATFAIGGPVDDSCGGGSFTGAIDDVRLYATPLAIDDMAAMMPPIPTSIDLLTTGPLVGQYANISAQVTPIPRFGNVLFEFIDPDTQAVVRSEQGFMDDTTQGVAYAQVYLPPQGIYELRVSGSIVARIPRRSILATIRGRASRRRRRSGATRSTPPRATP